MKSFKALMLLTLAATLSCGANGSPTNVTTDDYPTKASPAVLKGIMESLQGIAVPYFHQYGEAYPFTKKYVERLAWIRPYNYIICKVKHNYKFDGKEGEQWAHQYIYDPASQKDPNDPAGVWYDVIVGGSGWFERQGKGGWENWAWNGFVQKGQNMKSNHLIFINPPGGQQTEGGGD